MSRWTPRRSAPLEPKRRSSSERKAATLSGHWPLFRHHPDLARDGLNPLQLDSKPPSLPVKQYLYNETRYTMLAHRDPVAAAQLLEAAEEDILERWRTLEYLAARPGRGEERTHD